MLNEQTIVLNLVPGEVPPMAHVTQDDVGREIKLVLVDDNTAFNLSSSYTYSLRGTKPTGTGFAYDDVVTVSGTNSLSFKTNSVMTSVAGPVRCGIIIYDGDQHVETLAFILQVQESALSPETIIDSNDFQSIIESAVRDYIEEAGLVIDDTLSVSGAAADAKKTGDEINDLKSAIDLGSITPEVKTALLACFENVAWINEDGQDYYDALHDALYNRYWEVTNNLTNCTTSNESVQTIKGAAYSATITASTGYVMTGATVSITMGGNDITATAYSNGVISIPAVTGALVITISAAAKSVVSISAVYTQSGTVYNDDELDSLKSDLVVTATYDDSSTAVVTDYTLSGTLTAGTSTITVSYSGKTTTFNVTVTAPLYNIPDFAAQTVTVSSQSATIKKENGVYTFTGKTPGVVYVYPDGTVNSSKSNTLWFNTPADKPISNQAIDITWNNPGSTACTFSTKFSRSDATGNLASTQLSIAANSTGTEDSISFDNAAYPTRPFSALAIQMDGGRNYDTTISFKIRLFCDGVRYL